MKLRNLVLLLLVLAGIGAAGWAWWEQQNQLPAHVASGNGRIEATEVHIATRYPGRVADVLVGEGALVEAGQTLARMDTRELEASLADPEVLGDQARLRQATRRYKDLTPVVEAFRRYRSRQGDLEAARELLPETTGDERELLRAESGPSCST